MVVTNRLKRLRQSAHGLAAVLVIGCIGGLLAPTAFADDLSGLTAPTETVMVVGGSSAHGWADPNHNSYLRRGFDLLAKATHVNDRYVDQSIPIRGLCYSGATSCRFIFECQRALVRSES